jgi:hypothetical protein
MLTTKNEPEWIFPFEAMAIGDSFFIPTLHPEELIYAINCGAKRAKMRFRPFITTYNGLIGVRAWRIR